MRLRAGMDSSGQTVPGSITRHLQDFRAGDADAASRLWMRCVRLLLMQARKLLEGQNCRVADEEDVASIVFADVCKGLHNGQFDRIQDRKNLWRLLWMITRRRVQNHCRRFNSPLRKVDSALPLEAADECNDSSSDDQQVLDWMSDLQECLPNPALKEIASLLIAGHSDEYIAGKTALSLRSIERKVRVIEEKWRGLLNSGLGDA